MTLSCLTYQQIITALFQQFFWKCESLPKPDVHVYYWAKPRAKHTLYTTAMWNPFKISLLWLIRRRTPVNCATYFAVAYNLCFANSLLSPNCCAWHCVTASLTTAVRNVNNQFLITSCYHDKASGQSKLVYKHSETFLYSKLYKILVLHLVFICNFVQQENYFLCLT